MISPTLFEVVQCPDCGGRLAPGVDAIRCGGCGRTYAGDRGYLDLRPTGTFAEQTKYLDEALHADARHESIAPPLLGSKIRNDMLRAFLRLSPSDRVIDLGCGNGRALAWNADSGATLVGIDISPYFAQEAITRSNLVLGDLRRLPLRDRAFTKAWSLDVLEHLSPQALDTMLREANRVLADGGQFFVYTHARKNGPLAVGVRAVNKLAALGERIGVIDLRQERLRKSDHLNPIADHDDLQAILARTGFRLKRVTFYTPIAGAFVENVLARMAERWLARRHARSAPAPAPGSSPASAPATGAGDAAPADAHVRAARLGAQARLRQGGPSYWAVRAASSVMKLDIILFGRFRSGPFFALLEKIARP